MDAALTVNEVRVRQLMRDAQAGMTASAAMSGATGAEVISAWFTLCKTAVIVALDLNVSRLELLRAIGELYLLCDEPKPPS